MLSVLPKPLIPIVQTPTGRHLIGGSPNSAGALCPNCDLLLTRFFYIDLTDPTLGDHDTNLTSLELLYCWQCQLSQSEFSYQLGDFKVIKCATGPPEDDFPYEDYPGWFSEARVDFAPMSTRLAHQIEHYQELSSKEPDRLNNVFTLSERDQITTPRHQLGGTPFRFTNHTPTCPTCSAQMQFLMTVADASTDSRGFVGNEDVHVVYHLCLDCSMLTATQECD